MQKTTLRAMMLFTLLTLPQAVLAGSITYDIVNYPDLQNGWTLSGTITTDATMGPITQLDITSWTWSITKVVDNIVRDYTFRSTDPGGVVAGIGLTATSSELLLPFSDSNSFSLQTKAAALFDGVEPGPFGIAQALHTTASNQTGGEPVPYWTTRTTDPQYTESFVIASTTTAAAAVPEPSSLYLLGFGAVCGCVYVMGNKRRERRTARTEG